MTPKLKDGDYCFDTRGFLMETEGAEEIMEQAMIRLRARKGSYPLNPELGSELYRLDLNLADEAEIEAAVAEALAPMAEVELTGIEKGNGGDGRLILTVYLRIKGEDTLLELEGSEGGRL